MIDGCTFDNIIERIKYIDKYLSSYFKMLIVGMMANYGFMINMNDNVLYKTKMDTKRKN